MNRTNATGDSLAQQHMCFLHTVNGMGLIVYAVGVIPLIVTRSTIDSGCGSV